MKVTITNGNPSSQQTQAQAQNHPMHPMPPTFFTFQSTPPDPRSRLRSFRSASDNESRLNSIRNAAGAGTSSSNYRNTPPRERDPRRNSLSPVSPRTHSASDNMARSRQRSPSPNGRRGNSDRDRDRSGQHDGSRRGSHGGGHGGGGGGLWSSAANFLRDLRPGGNSSNERRQS